MYNLLAVLALASTCAHASPTDFYANLLFPRQDAGSCRNQSCMIATVAGSTGATTYDYPTYPTGDNQDGDCCIVRHFPAVKEEVYKERPNLQQYCASTGGDAPVDSNPPGVNSVSVASPTAAQKRQFSLPTSSSSSASCKKNILIFAKGTLEPSDLGVTLGPSLQQNLDSSKWDVIGVNYDNSLANDYCLGLPGGINARQLLASTVSKCPNSQIAVSGYSQGAMVIRNALARGDAAAVAKVKNFVTFGDPFCGAKIGQYTGPVHVFCQQGDGVCNGQLDISATHLSYSGSISAAVAILQSNQAN